MAINDRISTFTPPFAGNFNLQKQIDFYINEGSQSLQRRANRLPLWQHICLLILTDKYKTVKKYILCKFCLCQSFLPVLRVLVKHKPKH